jgi:hypothetical protein
LAGAAGYGWPTSRTFLHKAFEQMPAPLLPGWDAVGEGGGQEEWILGFNYYNLPRRKCLEMHFPPTQNGQKVLSPWESPLSNEFRFETLSPFSP